MILRYDIRDNKIYDRFTEKELSVKEIHTRLELLAALDQFLSVCRIEINSVERDANRSI